MERKDAIKTIKEADSCFCKHGAYKDCHSGCKYREALDAAVKALEQEATTKNDLGVDCVSRDEVLRLMQDNWHTHNGDWAMQESMDDIRALPSVTPQEPREGQWREDIDNNRRWDRVRFYCSECGDWQTYGKTHYCPNCGVKMVEPQESEDT